jgi:hypothetical protein
VVAEVNMLESLSKFVFWVELNTLLKLFVPFFTVIRPLVQGH